MAAIFLDYNSSTPVHPKVAEVLQAYTNHFGNPASSHFAGRTGKQALAKARTQVKNLIGADNESEIHFCSGGSEANNWCIKGIAFALKDQRHHVICSAIEHHSVMKSMQWLERLLGFRFSVVDVDSEGIVKLDHLRELVTEDTAIVSIMHANNEVGSIQPIRKIAEICHQKGAYLHVDAAQSLGKVPMNVQELGIDFLSVAGHKFYGPKGIGALYIRFKEVENWPTPLIPDTLIHGAPQEFGRRGGTENVLLIAALGEAAEQAVNQLEENRTHMSETRDLLQSEIQRLRPDAVINGPLDSEKRLPNTLSISLPGNIAADISKALSEEVGFSIGAACAYLKTELAISATLKAMGVKEDVAKGTMRLSTGRWSTNDEMITAAKKIVEVANSQKN